MDVDEFQSQIYTSKYPRVSTTNNGGGGGDEDDADDTPTRNHHSTVVAAKPQILADSMFRGWQHSSRIFRVSRASGGKDRHSKVLTSKGLRDRRVRLSVSTAIQFYDLQDRLGYDQPSKAVEWLIKAAADSIAELPSLTGPFPETPRQLCDAKLGFESSSAAAAAAAEADAPHTQQKMNVSMSKSASSTSETSKGSGLSLTRTDARVNQRVRARERARERAKEKESETEQAVVNAGQRRRQTAGNPISHPTTNNNNSSSFTELLTGAIGGNQTGSSPNSAPMMMDYFTNVARTTLGSHHHHQAAAACLFLGQTQMGNSINMPQAFHLTTGEHHNHHQQQHHGLQHFSFGQENLIPAGNEYDLNFTISSSSPSSLAGFNNRGTLQSNSPPAASPSSLLHHSNQPLQRYAASMEGSNNVVPAFFMTTASASSAMDTNHQHHHFPTGLDGRLHLYYGDGGGRHSDHKDAKGKN